MISSWFHNTFCSGSFCYAWNIIHTCWAEDPPKMFRSWVLFCALSIVLVVPIDGPLIRSRLISVTSISVPVCLVYWIHTNSCWLMIIIGQTKPARPFPFFCLVQAPAWDQHLHVCWKGLLCPKIHARNGLIFVKENVVIDGTRWHGEIFDALDWWKSSFYSLWSCPKSFVAQDPRDHWYVN